MYVGWEEGSQHMSIFMRTTNLGKPPRLDARCQSENYFKPHPISLQTTIHEAELYEFPACVNDLSFSSE